LLTGTVAAIAIVASMSFLPDKWFGRMDTIKGYEEDASAMSRLAMWGMSIRLAADHPVLGGGFDVFKNPSIYPRYFPTASRVRDVHSIYFQMLGEHGFVGLGIFVSIILLSLREAQLVKRRVRERADLQWANYMANCLQASIVGYAVSGAFLTLAFFDLFYLIVILTVCLRAVVSRALVEAESPVGASEDPSALPLTPPVPVRMSRNSQLISRR
jgi:putative inorganic carbon (hco3(-)) transporter